MAASGHHVITALHAVALVCCLAAAGLLARAFSRSETVAPRSASLLTAAGFAAHAVALVLYVREFNEPPLVGLGPSLSTLAWITGAFNLVVLLRREARSVALVLTPLVAVLIGAALLAGIAPEGEVAAFRGAWLSLHVLAAFIGYAALALAFASGLLYLIQFRELKGRRFGRIFSFFPSLDALDRLSGRALAIGFGALTIGLALGWAWTLRFRGGMDTENPQVIWGVLTWLVFVGTLIARRGGADRERRGALVAVAGFLVVVITYVALRVGGASEGFL